MSDVNVILSWFSDCVERGATAKYLHMMELLPVPPNHLQFHQNPEWLTFLVPAHPSCPGKEADKQVSTYAAKK